MNPMESNFNSMTPSIPSSYNGQQLRNAALVGLEEQSTKPQFFFYNLPRHGQQNYVTEKVVKMNTGQDKNVCFNANCPLESQFQDRPKNRRLTLPNIISQPDSMPQVQCPLSPNNNKTTPIRINFSYKPQQFMPKQLISNKFQINQSTIKSIKFPAQAETTKLQRQKLSKQMKFKLSSNVICYYYVPQKLGKTRPTPSFIKSLTHSKSQPQIGTSKTLNRSQSHPNNLQVNLMKESNENSTQTTKSIVEKKVNDVPPFQEAPKLNKNGLFPSKKNIFMKPQGSSLLEELSVAKTLHKTVLFDNTNYDFGGLILREENTHQLHTNASLSSQNFLDSQKEAEARQWKSYVKRLIIDESHQNLKQSVHCSPDIRNEFLQLDLLHSFGRAIKESYIAHQE